jgi:predicted lipid-binding transport protein (Tim44 family)
MEAYSKENPRTAWTISGAMAGALIGLLLIGNVGVAGGGGAIAVSGWLIGMLIGGYIGFRIGEAKLKRRIQS